MIGTDPPPIENLPNRTGVDPHGDPRVAPGDADGLRLPDAGRAERDHRHLPRPLLRGRVHGPRSALTFPDTRRLGGVVTQRPAKPFTPVRFR